VQARPSSIDLNSDLGEGFGRWSLGDDEAMLALVSSANVACGFHAGDPSIMRRVCRVAAERGVAVGAHVSYRDLEGFGRREIPTAPDELIDGIAYQIGALAAIARAAGTRVSYVKPHGALYNVAARSADVADTVATAVKVVDPGLPILGLPGRSRSRRPSGTGSLRWGRPSRIEPTRRLGCSSHGPRPARSSTTPMSSPLGASNSRRPAL